MIRVDDFLDRVPSAQYKCFDFAREVWLASFGEDMGDKLKGFLGAASSRRFVLSDIRKCVRLDAPVDPCFVLMRGGKNVIPHVGIWYQGRVLHLSGTGAQYMPLKMVAWRYPRVDYFL